MMRMRDAIKLNLVQRENLAKNNQMNILNICTDDDWIFYGMYVEGTKARDKLAVKLWNKFGRFTDFGMNYGYSLEYTETIINGRYWGGWDYAPGGCQAAGAVLYLLLLYAEDNCWKNQYLVAKDMGESYRFLIVPWDLDYSFGLVYDDKQGWPKGYGYDVEYILPNPVTDILLVENNTNNIAESIRERWPNGLYEEDTSSIEGYLKDRLPFLDRYIMEMAEEKEMDQ